ncbi:MAG: aldo/keto reductase [Clostridia bacterium]|nr:aldo/keto reductase [Clostridia bacterium]
MIYRDFKGLQISNLGLGMMRLPTLNEDSSSVDEETVFRMVDTAMKNGINYFDTAWGYHKGMSEGVAGRALGRYPRESYFLADKFPGYDLDNMGKAQEIFEQQLKRCGTDYIDFYLLHNVYEFNIDSYLEEDRYHTVSYLLEQKRAGRIRHLGFSAHGSVEVMRRFLDSFGKDMEFCQVQLNWLDWTLQDAKSKVALLNEWNIPIWVMEPLQGGKLVNLSPERAGKLEAQRPGASIPDWAFRFLQGIPGVTVILSGMSNEQQLQENIRIFETDRPLDAEENAKLLSIAEDMTKDTSLPCTACRYCTAYCPKGLNIPWLLRTYNEFQYTGASYLISMSLKAQPDNKKPSACIGCRSCEKVCPQKIKISEAIAKLAEATGT